MPLRTGPSEVVEADVKPLIDLLVDLVVEVADLFRGLLLLHRLHLCRCAVFVSPADVEYIRAL